MAQQDPVLGNPQDEADFAKCKMIESISFGDIYFTMYALLIFACLVIFLGSVFSKCYKKH